MGRSKKTELTGYAPTLQGLSLAVGVSSRSVCRWKYEGLISKDPQGWSVGKALTVKLANAQKNRGGDRTGGSQDWKDRKLKAQALMAELDLKHREDELVSKDEAAAAWRARLIEIRTAFQSMGRDLAPQLAGRKAREIQGMIEEQVFLITNKLQAGASGGSHE